MLYKGPHTDNNAWPEINGPPHVPVCTYKGVDSHDSHQRASAARCSLFRTNSLWLFVEAKASRVNGGVEVPHRSLHKYGYGADRLVHRKDLGGVVSEALSTEYRSGTVLILPSIHRENFTDHHQANPHGSCGGGPPLRHRDDIVKVFAVDGTTSTVSIHAEAAVGGPPYRKHASPNVSLCLSRRGRVSFSRMRHVAEAC